MIEFLIALKKRIILIALIVIAGTGCALYFAMFGTRTYEAKVALLMYSDDNSDPLDAIKSRLGVMASTMLDMPEVLNNITKSNAVADMVVKKLNLENDPEFRDAVPKNLRGNHNAFLESFKLNLKVEILQPRIIVSFTSADPKKAAVIANAYAGTLRDYMLDIKNKSYQFYLMDFDRNKKDLEILEQQVALFEEKNSIVSVDDQLKEQVANYGRLNTQISELEGEAAGLRETVNTSADPLKISQAQSRLAAVSTELSRARSEFGKIQSAAEKMPREKLDYFRLKRDFEKKQAYVLAMEQQVVYLKLKIEQNASKFIILDPAYPPLYPSAPQRKKMAIFGFLGSLAIGIALALFLELYARQLEIYNKKALEKS